AFVGGDGNQDVDGQLVGVGVVAGNELDAILLEVGHDGDGADQAVDLGDDQSGAGVVGVGGCGAGLGSAVDGVVHAALDLDVGLQEVAADHAAVGFDRGLLGLESQAALALAVGGDSHQADQFGRHRLFPPSDDEIAFVHIVYDTM